VNGDGIDDLIIGANGGDPNGVSNAGESYVVFGGPGMGAGGVIELSSLNGFNGFVLNGIDGNDQSGGSVSSAGDVNGDGIDDIIIGAPSADPNGNADAGESYVIFGRDIPPCLPDLNKDGVVDNGDIIAFVSLFLTGNITADLNGDGILDNGDIITFVSLFLAGC